MNDGTVLALGAAGVLAWLQSRRGSTSKHFAINLKDLSPEELSEWLPRLAQEAIFLIQRDEDHPTTEEAIMRYYEACEAAGYDPAYDPEWEAYAFAGAKPDASELIEWTLPRAIERLYMGRDDYHEITDDWPWEQDDEE